jgi:hypothetical protein
MSGTVITTLADAGVVLIVNEKKGGARIAAIRKGG